MLDVEEAQTKKAKLREAVDQWRENHIERWTSVTFIIGPVSNIQLCDLGY